VFSDPQSVTISGSAKSLARTSSVENGARFATSDRTHRMSVQHSYGKRQRHTIRLEVDTVTASPLITGQNVLNSASFILTADLPNGYDAATAKAALDGFLANLSATSGANLTKLLGGES
jgi:hypothetical protein